MSAPSLPSGASDPRATAGSFGLVRSAFGATWRTLVAMSLSQFLLSSLILIGWTYRWMQGSAVRYWRRKTGVGVADPAGWPEWAIRSGGGARTLFAPLAENLRIGAQALLTTWTLTLPACALWQFGWFAGWDNSFNKGYEQTFVGAGIAWIGIAMFVAAMLYLPIAQARHAATGEWRVVFDFRTNRAIAKDNRLFNLLLAVGYAVGSLPLTVLTIAPYFVANNNPALLDLSAAEQLAWLQRFYFWGALPLVGLFVALRLFATRIYARGLLDLVRSGEIPRDDLRGLERETIDELDCYGDHAASEKPHIALWATRGFGRSVAVGLTIALWLGFTAQIFIGQFLHYRPVRGWLNQPLVQAPWMRHIPAALADRTARVSKR